MTDYPDREPTTADGEQFLRVLSALANPHRLRVLAALVEERQYVSELARRLEIGRPLLHMHLQKLEAAGLVVGSMTVSKEGKAMKFYEVTDFDIRLTPEEIARAVETLGTPEQKGDDK